MCPNIVSLSINQTSSLGRFDRFNVINREDGALCRRLCRRVKLLLSDNAQLDISRMEWAREDDTVTCSHAVSVKTPVPPRAVVYATVSLELTRP